MAIFKQEGAFTGKKVGVVGTSADHAEMTLVGPALKKVKANVVQTAVNTVPETDTTAQIAEYSVIAQKFQSSGVERRGRRGQRGERLAGLAPGQPEHLHAAYRSPPTTSTSTPTCPTRLGYSQSIIKNALTAGATRPSPVVWNDPAMKSCVATIKAAEPNASINNPVTATASTPVTWTAPETACQQVALFTDIVKAAGKTLTDQTFAKGGASLTHVTIPGGGGTFNFSGGHNDGNGPGVRLSVEPVDRSWCSRPRREERPAGVPSRTSGRHDGDAGGARRTVELAVADPGCARAPAARRPAPRSCSTSSWSWRRPDAPIGSPLAMRPPSVLTGRLPPISVAPSASSASCSPSLQNPFSAMWMTSAPASVSCSWTTSTSSGPSPAIA